MLAIRVDDMVQLVQQQQFIAGMSQARVEGRVASGLRSMPTFGSGWPWQFVFGF